jgi:hypothetical protein
VLAMRASSDQMILNLSSFPFLLSLLRYVGAEPGDHWPLICAIAQERNQMNRGIIRARNTNTTRR